MTSLAVSSAIGSTLIERLASDVSAAAAWLSELDGAIGDGDHGVNLRRGFELVIQRLPPNSSLADGLHLVGKTLLEDVGGAMGPLYGILFLTMSSEAEDHDTVNATILARMLVRGANEVAELGGAQPGDKTLIDVLLPATNALSTSIRGGSEFADALEAMATTAEHSRDATSELIARIGRSSRMADRSRGHIDAGAASCAVILRSIATTFQAALRPSQPPTPASDQPTTATDTRGPS